MKTRMAVVFPALAAVLSAAVQVPVAWPGVQRTVTIAVSTPPETFAPNPPAPPSPPVTLVVGTEVHLTTLFRASDYSTFQVTWAKDGHAIGAGATYIILHATSADSGIYTAVVNATDATGRTFQYFPQAAAILVTHEGQRLLNTSTRAHIDAGNPSVMHGFVVEPSPSPVLLLIRAVGPKLAAFGVSDPLAKPTLKVFDSAGREQTPDPTNYSATGVLPTVSEAGARVGAFPLPAGTADVARVYYLPSGAYTATVSSADNGSGTALLELYEVPMDVQPYWWMLPP